MEDVLDVYTQPHDREKPLVCLDETSKQMVAETRTPVPMKEGRSERVDYEYERNGTANLFMLFAPLEGWRHVEVTDHRTAVDYAHILKDLSDVHFPHAQKIILVQDNLNTHAKASLYEAFPPAEARRLAERFEWHYTPKHELCGKVGDGPGIDQAAVGFWFTSMPSANLTPVITFGNWFCPSSRRHELCAAWISLNTMIMPVSCERQPLDRVVR